MCVAALFYSHELSVKKIIIEVIKCEQTSPFHEKLVQKHQIRE